MNVHVHLSYYDTEKANDVESGLGYWSFFKQTTL